MVFSGWNVCTQGDKQAILGGFYVTITHSLQFEIDLQTTKSKTGTTPRPRVASSVVTRNTVGVRLLHPSLLTGGGRNLFILYPLCVHSQCLCTGGLKFPHHTCVRWILDQERLPGFLMSAEKIHTFSNEGGDSLVVSDSAHTSSFRHVSSWMEKSACACMRVCVCVSPWLSEVLTQFLCCGLASPEHDLEYTEGHSHSCKRSPIKMQRCNSSASKDRSWRYPTSNTMNLQKTTTLCLCHDFQQSLVVWLGQ